MSDLFGFSPPKHQFKDISNQRDTAAEEKAELCKVLNDLLRKAPASLSSASVQRVREWRAQHEASLEVLKNKRSSRVDLGLAIKRMREFENE